MHKQGINSLLLILLLLVTACEISNSPKNESTSAARQPLNPSFDLDTPTSPPPATATYTQTPLPSIVYLDNVAIQSQLEALGETFIADHRNAGLSVALIVRDPHTGQLRTLLLNFGVASKDSKAAATSDTIYEIGSLTKVFT